VTGTTLNWRNTQTDGNESTTQCGYNALDVAATHENWSSRSYNWDYFTDLTGIALCDEA
jgi:hypothetical protein